MQGIFTNKPDWSALRRLLIAHAATADKAQYIDGIYVLLDNAYMAKANGTASDIIANSDYFITGWYDSGYPEGKNWKFGPAGTSNYANMASRFFNDVDGTSVDYWGPNQSSIKAFSSPGQFVISTIYKPTAKNFYLLQVATNTYAFKGSSVE